MFNKNHKKKYLRYTDSVDDDNNSGESENEKGNIDLIINKLEKKVNTGNIHSGNADVILKMTSQNQDTARTTKNNDSLINNLSNLIANNIQEKDNDLSQDIGNSIISANSMPKTLKKSLIDVDINLNNDLKEDLEMQENNGGNKFNVILSTNNSNSNFNNNFNSNSNNLLSRNKILNINEKSTLSTLSQHLDNSKYFLNKKNNGLITNAKNEKETKEKNDKNNKKEDVNIKLSINDKDEKIKDKKNKKIKNIKKINIKKYRLKFFWSDCCDKTKWRRRWRNCNIITIIRDIFITIIIVSALAFYATIFIMG